MEVSGQVLAMGREGFQSDRIQQVDLTAVYRYELLVGHFGKDS